ncbi:MAG: glycosyltransferase family 4 protein, partial [Caldilineaceae bacterium]|nr:glycosyltransferase family 4 protein [Caldilineaceae bacterium]
MVWIGTDFERLAGLQAKAHHTFNVGYIGAVDFVKMHPNFVALCGRVDVPKVRFLVYGSGGGLETLRRQAEALQVAKRFEFGGYLDDIRPLLQRLDIFGYPLCEGTYASAEMVLQEAMFAGVPPVIFDYGGA